MLLLASLDHPSIPVLGDYFYVEEPGRFYVVSEYISGEDLVSRMHSGISHRRKPIYESLATLASLTALVVGLVAALGFPAAILQFNRLRIPTELLSMVVR